MKEYSVKILDTVFADIEYIANYIVSINTPEHAAKYSRELQAEIMSLRYIAGIYSRKPLFISAPLSSSCKAVENS